MENLINELKVYLDELAKQDEFFAAKYDPGKLKDCAMYIASEVQKVCKGGKAMVDNVWVFQKAKDFYMDDVKEVKTTSFSVISSNHELTEEERKRIDEESSKQAEKQIEEDKETEAKRRELHIQKEIAKEKARKIETAKKNEQKAMEKAKAEEKKKKESGQMSLFDWGGISYGKEVTK